MVKDTTYYDLLQVESTATDVELKKAYRKQAIKLHPDKNQNDPHALEKFQDLGEAYNVLKDPQQRAIYDELGVEGMKEQANGGDVDADPLEMFAAIFGGEAFTSWFGELLMFKDMLKTADIMEEDGEPTTVDGKLAEGVNGVLIHGQGEVGGAEAKQKTDVLSSEGIEKKKKQKISREQREKIYQLHEQMRAEKQKRVDTLATELEGRLQKIIDSKNADPSIAMKKLDEELQEMKDESFGLQFVHLIGSIYVNKAQAAINSARTFGISKIYSGVKSKTNTMKNGILILKTALKAQAALEEMVKEQEAIAHAQEAGMELTDELKYRQMEMERTIMGKFLATAWALSKYEVTDVLNKVCDQVLNNKKLTKKERGARADALLALGKHMEKVRRTPQEEEEARIFEEMVADATAKKQKKLKKHYGDLNLFVNEEDKATSPPAN